jgi:hypothetical protein
MSSCCVHLYFYFREDAKAAASYVPSFLDTAVYNSKSRPSIHQTDLLEEGTDTPKTLLPCEQDWLEIRLEAPADRLGLTGLACGSRFQAQLAAFNRVGLGAPSTILHFSTAGAGKHSFLLVNTIKPSV